MRLRLKVFWAMVAGCLALLLAGSAQANNLVVTNLALSRQDLDAKTVNVAFDLSWANSWRGGENWDAAWVFVKFRAPGSNNWQHATLSSNSSDHTPAPSSTISTVPDGKGVFVYRSTGYTGSVNYAQMRLLWNYGTNGYSFAKGALVEVSVQAIEMVYIPAGPFRLGSTGAETGRFYAPDGTAQTTNAYLVSSESAITVGTASGNLYYMGVGGNPGDAGTPLPDTFSKGYNAFYCMKYEISQGQYADFLNRLTGLQWTNRFANQNGNNRHTISGSCTNVSAGAPDRACNYVSWGDGCAYAAWAGLRPMTEVEFEKACRGAAYPVANEYAWGSTVVTQLTSEVGSGGTETSGTPGANCNYGGPMGGPVRAGFFATAGSSRQSAGAGYYGVMELSGNLDEACVPVGTVNGRNFRGSLGSGVLDVNGGATNSDWSVSGGGAYRGGNCYYASTTYLYASDRTHYAGNANTGRSFYWGWRGVRQAP